MTNGATYFYKLSAANANGTSSQSAEVSAKPQVPVLAPPTGLVATRGVKRSLKITVSWTASVGATSYKVYQSTSNSGTYTLLSTISSSFANTGLKNGVTYYYKVAAANATSSSTLAGPVSATAW